MNPLHLSPSKAVERVRRCYIDTTAVYVDKARRALVVFGFIVLLETNPLDFVSRIRFMIVKELNLIGEGRISHCATFGLVSQENEIASTHAQLK